MVIVVVDVVIVVVVVVAATAVLAEQYKSEGKAEVYRFQQGRFLYILIAWNEKNEPRECRITR